MSCLLAIATASAALAVETPVRYRVTFQATWSEETHPQSIPAYPHFSPLVGSTHDDDVAFWWRGGLATTGIERMAEQGLTDPLASEILAASVTGHASSDVILGPGIDLSPGVAWVEFAATLSHSRLTLVSMLAPSPDWFVGTSGLPLRNGETWHDNVVIDLYAYDAGTDSGATYQAPNQATSPQEPIARIVDPPLGTDGEAPTVGSFTFEIVDVGGLPPYEDTDEDTLPNIVEAGRGTSPRVADTDGDGSRDDVDNCPLKTGLSQADDDGDGVGTICDRCPLTFDPDQTDSDDDGDGDLCDFDDGILVFTEVSRTGLAWQDDATFVGFNLYRGGLSTLRESGVYTQDPAAAAADRQCGLPAPVATDADSPSPGETLFYLVSGVDGGGDESPLGVDDDRPNTDPCAP